MKRFSSLCVFLFFLSAIHVTNAIDAVDIEDPEMLARYKALAKVLRCPKCQNQNLADSNSAISSDLRDEVVRLLKEGKTNEEIVLHLRSLYGDYIIYQPPVQKNTLVLWFGPGVILGIALIVFGVIIYRRSKLSVDDVEDGEYPIEPEGQEAHKNISKDLSEDTHDSSSKNQ